jgi:hypothetical protein
MAAWVVRLSGGIAPLPISIVLARLFLYFFETITRHQAVPYRIDPGGLIETTRLMTFQTCKVDTTDSRSISTY